MDLYFVNELKSQSFSSYHMLVFSLTVLRFQPLHASVQHLPSFQYKHSATCLCTVHPCTTQISRNPSLYMYWLPLVTLSTFCQYPQTSKKQSLVSELFDLAMGSDGSAMKTQMPQHHQVIRLIILQRRQNNQGCACTLCWHTSGMDYCATTSDCGGSGNSLQVEDGDWANKLSNAEIGQFLNIVFKPHQFKIPDWFLNR